MEIQNPAVQLVLERLLGQVLFAPPNVAGWPGGKHWIDSSSLMLRMQLPQVMYRSDAIQSKPKDDDDVMMGMREQAFAANIRRLKNPGGQFFQTKIFWDQYLRYFDSIKEEDLYGSIRDLLLQRVFPMNETGLVNYIDETNRQTRIESITIRLMGTPEYQLC